MVNWAMVSKKPVNIAVPMIGRFNVVISDANLNLLVKLSRVFLLVGLVSSNKNAAQSVPINEIPAAKKKGACGLTLLKIPPINGPITNPNANAELKMPNRCARFFGVAVSATIACATEILPPVKPSKIRAAKRKSRLRASANNKNEIQVPARLITNRGLLPHLSDKAQKTGVAKNCAIENDAVSTPSVAPLSPKVLP